MKRIFPRNSSLFLRRCNHFTASPMNRCCGPAYTQHILLYSVRKWQHYLHATEICKLDFILFEITLSDLVENNVFLECKVKDIKMRKLKKLPKIFGKERVKSKRNICYTDKNWKILRWQHNLRHSAQVS